MAHASHDDSAEIPIDGYLSFEGPSDVIPLYDGPLQLRIGDEVTGERPGRLALVIRSGSRLTWGVDLDGASHAERRRWRYRPGTSTATLRLPFRESQLELETYLGGDGDGFFGHPSTSGSDDASLVEAIAHWVNLPHLPLGSLLCRESDDGAWVEWSGRWMLALGDWRITIDERSDLADCLATARRERLYAVTHVMRVRRRERQAFAPEDLRTLLSCLQVGLSFALGRWTAPVLPVGHDDTGTIVWSEWAALNVDSPAKAHGRWWVEDRPDDLRQYIERFFERWTDPDARRSVSFLAVSAIASGESTFVEQQIQTALAAIEHLSWLAEVRSGHQSEATWRKAGAPRRIRRVLTQASVPSEIDARHQPLLACFAKSVVNGDGPAALCALRDSITHPKEADERYRVPGLLGEASRLATRYLELALLRWLDYDGHMADRTITTGWAGESRAVPWAPSDKLTSAT